MNGVEIKKILTDNGFVLAKVASKMGISPQNLNNLLSADDVKTGTMERICRAINETIYFFYANKAYKDIAPRPDFPPVGDVVSLEKYEKKVEECALLRAELEALKSRVSVRAEGEEGVLSIGSLETTHI